MFDLSVGTKESLFFSLNSLFIASQRLLFGAGEVTALEIWIKNLKGDSMWIYVAVVLMQTL